MQNSSKDVAGFSNRGLDVQQESGGVYQLNNVTRPLANPPQPKMWLPQRPDIIENDPMIMQPIPHSSPNCDQVFAGQEDAEHYDLENASSIAPSDIDIVYHYKGYRTGNRYQYNSEGKRNKKLQKHHNTPLARLSPSSEVSHAPRILTLGDLSGKTLPPGLLVEQSERSLNSPVSHISSGSRNSHHIQNRGGLTSENVARFNQRATPQKSTLLNTMDLLSVGSESRKKNNFDSKSPTLDDDSSTSSDDVDEDDSFTCSEFDYDEIGPQDKKDISDLGGGMVFNRLVSPQNGKSGSANKPESSDEDLDYALPEGKTWENLLSWTPSYSTFSGVFCDIAELPHSSIVNDLGVCRPSPLGDRSDEQYI